MVSVLKGVVTEPSATFRDIDQTATPAGAAGVVVAAGLLSRGLLLARESNVEPLGVFLLMALGLASSLLIWFLLSLLCHQVAIHFFRGQATFRITLTAVGFAYVTHLIAAPVQALLSLTPLARLPLPVVFFAWFVVLLVIGLREAQDMANGRALLSLLLGGILPVFLWFQISFFVIPGYVGPHLRPVPWGDPMAPSWETAPEGLVNLIANPGFEERDAKADAPETPAHWQRSKVDMPLGDTILHRDGTVAKSGKASAAVTRTGVPIGFPNGWLQKVEGVKPGEWVYVELWMKTEQVTAAAAMVGFRDKEGLAAPTLKAESESRTGGKRARPKSGKPFPTFNTLALTGTHNWQPQRVKMKVPEDAAQLIVGVHLWGAGRLWVDDVRVLHEPVKEPPAEPAARPAQEPGVPEAAKAAKAPPSEKKGAAPAGKE